MPEEVRDGFMISKPRSEMGNALVESVKACTKPLIGNGLDSTIAHRVALNELFARVSEELDFTLPFELTPKAKQRVMFPTLRETCSYLKKHPDVIDRLYYEVVPYSHRGGHGQFATPYPIAQFMTLWGDSQGCESVLDPAVGTGIFLDYLSDLNKCDMTGFDIDTVALNACSLRLRLKDHGSRLDLVNEDFLLSMPNSAKPDFVVCNPPYLNFHDYDSAKMAAVFDKLMGVRFSRLTNIYPFFFLKSYALLRENGAMAFITPSEFFYTGYGKQLKTFLQQRFVIHAFIVTDFEKLAFSDALTTSVVTLLTKRKPNPTHKVKFILVSSWPEAKDLLGLVSGKVNSLKGCKIREVSQSDLDPNIKWQAYFGDNGTFHLIPGLTRLSAIASVNRGIATGANKFFTLTREEIQKWGISDEFLKPVVSSLKQAPHYDYTPDDHERACREGRKCMILDCRSKPSRGLADYIKYGESIGINKRYLPSHRNPWFSKETQTISPILATVFSRKKSRFLLNTSECLTLTCFHCIYPKSRDTTEVKALLAFLNSGVSEKIQEYMRREYGGGLHKFEPGDLEDLHVLDVGHCRREDKIRLARLFDKLCITTREGGNESDVLAEIDRCVHSVVTPGKSHAENDSM